MKKWLSSKIQSSNPRRTAGSQDEITSVDKSYVNAVYYPNWKAYNGQGPSSLKADYITHVFYAFIWPSEDGSITFSDDYVDTKIEIDGVIGCIAALTQFKSQHSHLKTLVSIGGGGGGSSKFALIAGSERLRETFVRNVRQFVDAHGFDGVDIDWEHPQNPGEGESYVNLLHDLRKVLPSSDYILTSALPAGEWALQNIPLARSVVFLDFINIMAYDFAGPWVSQVGHHAQLYAPKRPHNEASRISGDSAIRYLKSKGIPSHRLVLGIPLYGRSFLGATRIGDSYTGHGGNEGTFEYRDLSRPGIIEQFDRDTVAAYCIGGDGGFVTYDIVETVTIKAEYVRSKQLGGMFYWTGTGDADGPRSLVRAGFEILHQP